MSSSARPRQSATAQRSNRGSTVLPAYQPPTNPLNEAAQRALHDLPRTHNLAILNKHLQIANDTLTNAAGDVNDRYQRKAHYQQRQNARRAAQGIDESDDEGNGAVEEMREKVEEMTSRMEESVRKIIDARATVANVESALRELDTNVAAGNGAIAPTQSTLGASQFRQRRRGQGEEDSEDESSQKVIIGPTGLLKRNIAEQQTEYEGLSMRDRYATNNDYIGFKQMVHDSLHPGENAPPVPHASTWFSQPNTEATPGGTKKDRPAAVDDDDDLEIASERINIKCPLTLLPMKNPVTSKKCPHSFEKEAIMEMISISTARIGGGSQSQRRGPAGGEKAIKCPVCEVVLAASDLYSDPVLIRKIKRIQADQRLQDEESDDETPIPRGSQRPQAEEIGSGDEDGNMSRAARMRSLAPRIKAEKLASSARQVSVVPNSQPVLGSGVVDLEDEEQE